MTPLLDRLPALRRVPVIGILRRCPPDRVVDVVGAAAAAGLLAVELTMDLPDAAASIDRVRREWPDLVVGAGTVLSQDAVDRAVDHGAAFIVSPVFDSAVVDRCRDHGVPAIPGAATATEVLSAYRGGAAAVKLFPAEQLGGPDYVRALRAPLPDVPLVPTGGVDARNARHYLAAGAVAVAVGSGVFTEAAMGTGDTETIQTATKALLETLP